MRNLMVATAVAILGLSIAQASADVKVTNDDWRKTHTDANGVDYYFAWNNAFTRDGLRYMHVQIVYPKPVNVTAMSGNSPTKEVSAKVMQVLLDCKNNTMAPLSYLGYDASFRWIDGQNFPLAMAKKNLKPVGPDGAFAPLMRPACEMPIPAARQE